MVAKGESKISNALGCLKVDFSGLSRSQTSLMVCFIIASCFVLSLTVIVYAQGYWDNDIWFILNTGRDILKHGFSRVEPFTVHEDFSYLTQQWLASAIDWKLYEAAGVWGVELFYLALWVTILVCAYRVAMVMSDGRTYLSCAVVSVFILSMAPFIKVNPRGFDFLAILLTILVMHRFAKSGKIVVLALLPLIEVALVNLHGSMWSLPFFVPLSYLVMQRGRGLRFRLSIAVSLAAMGLCLFANPYGADMIVYIVDSLSVASLFETGIGELQPVTLKMMPAYPFLLLLGLFLFVCARCARFRRGPFFLLMIATALMGLLAVRNATLFYTVSVAYFSWSFAQEDFSGVSSALRRTFSLDKFYLGVLGACAIAGLWVVVPGFSQKGIDEGAAARVEALRSLNAQVQEKREDKATLSVYTGFNDGGYFEFEGYRCYIDARAEVFGISVNKQKDVLGEYTAYRNGFVRIVDFVRTYDFDYLVSSSDDRMFVCEGEVEEAGYAKLFENDEYKLYGKK